MTGARSPAAAATLVNLAWNGSPEGLPRGTGATPREAIPPYRCARAAAASAGNVRICRRVTTPSGGATGRGGGGRAYLLVWRPHRRGSVLQASASTHRPVPGAEPAG